MPKYDITFNPPAPVAEVTIAHPLTNDASGILPGKFDTGADVTVIPEIWIASLGLSPKGFLWARGYEGSYSQRPVYYVRMTVESFPLATVRCIASVRDNVLLGRNVLNRFLITLDGKQQFFTLTP